MKISNLFLLVVSAVLLNPRVNFENKSLRPRSVVSCSTGWSLQWGKGLIGIYSLDSAAQLMSNRPTSVESSISKQKASRPIGYQLARDRILQACNK